MINYGDEEVPYRPIPTTRPTAQQHPTFQSPSKISDHGSVEFTSPQKVETRTVDEDQAKEFNDASHWSETHEENLPELE